MIVKYSVQRADLGRQGLKQSVNPCFMFVNFTAERSRSGKSGPKNSKYVKAKAPIGSVRTRVAEHERKKVVVSTINISVLLLVLF